MTSFLYFERKEVRVQMSKLIPDCENCFGLCCVALPYAKSADFKLSIKKQASHVQILRLIIAVKFMLTSGEKASEDVPHLSALVQASKYVKTPLRIETGAAIQNFRKKCLMCFPSCTSFMKCFST